MEKRKLFEGIPHETIEPEELKSRTERIQEFFVGLKNALEEVSPDFAEAYDDIQKETGAFLPEPVIEETVASLEAWTEALPKESQSLLKRFRDFPASFKRTLMSLVVAAEVTAGGVAFAQHKEKKADRPKARITEVAAPSEKEEPYETIYPEPRPPEPTRLVLGDRSVAVENDRSGIFIRHNIGWPESLAEVGKMFVEPISIGFKFLFEKDSWEGRLISGGERNDFLFSVDIPYEYARDFQKASPTDQKAMEKEMEKNARELLHRLLPVVVGLSFFKEDVAEEMEGRGYMHLTEVSVDGFASPESDYLVEADDVRNQKLSELRAENAAHIIGKLLEERRIEADKIQHRGRGELHFSEEERENLLKDAYKITMRQREGEGDVVTQNQALLELIRRYNDRKITDGEMREELDRIIGQKRKVALTIEADERTGIFVLPIPLALPLLFLLWRREGYRAARGQLYIHCVPRWRSAPGMMDSREWREARQIGRNLREDSYHRVSRFRDVIKGYTPSEEPHPERTETIVGASRHFRKRAVRERVELSFQEDLSEEERIQALAFVIDRQARLAPRLHRRYRRRAQRGALDIVDSIQDPETLERFLQRITAWGRLRGGDGRIVEIPPPHLRQEDPPPRFEVIGYGAQGGGGTERQGILGFHVQVGERRYNVLREQLVALANQYSARERLR